MRLRESDRSRRTSRGDRRCAYTLYELITVITLLGLVAAVAAPRHAAATAEFRVRSLAERVRADLELARTSARSAGKNLTVTFNVGANHYSLSEIKDPDHPVAAYDVLLNNFGYPATLVNVSLGSAGTSSVVTFNMYGRPDAGGTIVVGSGSLQRTLRINGTTGYVEIL